jgi:flagellar basal-body rod protein FlgB
MNNIFGVAEKALTVAEERANLLSTNLVNSSTPNYKAKDINFDQVMKNVESGDTLNTTSSQHIKTASSEAGGLPLQYRIPMQVSMDGNTVDPEIERKNFMQNSLKYQVSLTFIQNKTDQLMKAMKGD